MSWETRKSAFAGVLCHVGVLYYVYQAFASGPPSLPGAAIALVGAHLFVDLVALLTHVTLDNYFTPQTRGIGYAIYFFREHHVDPHAMFGRSYSESNYENILAGIAWMAVWLPFELPPAASLFVGWAALGAAYVTEIHRWAHLDAPPAPARWLQRSGIIVNREHHERHHEDPRYHYGLYAGWIDRITDALRIPESIELVTYLATGSAAVNSRLGLPAGDRGTTTLAERCGRIGWRAWYEFLPWYSRRQGATFSTMNWGYDEEGLSLGVNGDAAERYPLQLYHVLVRDVDVEDGYIVDVSCGRGGGIDYLTRARRPRRALGIDFSERNVATCRRAFDAEGSPLRFRHGAAEKTGLAENEVDVVVSVEASHCYPNTDAFLEESSRILKPGGTLAWTDFLPTEELPRLRKLVAERFHLRRERDITEHVLSAMRKDGARRRQLIEDHCAWFLRPAMRNFAASNESVDTYRRLADGTYSYFLIHARKPDDAPSRRKGNDDAKDEERVRAHNEVRRRNAPQVAVVMEHPTPDEARGERHERELDRNVKVSHRE